VRVRREDSAEEYTLDDSPLGQGGEGAVYGVRGNSELVAKIFFHPTKNHAEKLAAMLSTPPCTHAASGPIHVAWPVARLLSVEAGAVVGYIMPRLTGARPVCDFYHPGTRRRCCPLFSYAYLVRTARNLAAAVQSLHDSSFVIGDLNESNVLVTNQATVTLVDTDSFQIKDWGRLFCCPVAKPEFTPPELQGAFVGDLDRLREHDAFALAVLIFQLLMQGVHPFSGIYTGSGETPSLADRIAAGWWPYAWHHAADPVQPPPYAPPWWVLPPRVQDLLSACFEDGHANPSLRPTAQDWRDALEESERQLVICAINQQHVFVRGLDTCPWCVLYQNQDRDPFPSRQELQDRRDRALQSAAQIGQALVVPPLPMSACLREDDLPYPAAVCPPSSWLDRTLCGIGAAIESQPWSVWIAAGALAALAGVLATLATQLPPGH
jgi:DNA-binding helix-hairpin-helix protein with protein kinase domain